MAIGKNKRKPKKTAKAKRTVDMMSRKEWYTVHAPPLFVGSAASTAASQDSPVVGRTFVNRSGGGKLASDALLGRVFSVSLADLHREHSDDQSYKNVKLITERVVGDACLTNFYGMALTTDRIKSLVRKWHTLVDVPVNIVTTDGTRVRIFVITFTKRRPGQVRKTTYAQTSQVKKLRARIVEVVTHEAASCDLRQLFEKISSDVVCRNIESATSNIFPLQNTHIYKVKLVQRASTERSRIDEMYPELIAKHQAAEDIGVPVNAAVG